MSTRVFGPFPDSEPHGRLEMSWWLQPGRLRRDWSDVSEVANFVADYLAAKFEGREIRELRDSASFVVNELIENAVKYCTDGLIQASGSATDESWTFLISHGSSPGTAEGLEAFLARLEDSTPEELMIEQVERNFEDDSSGSGLGLISIMADHGANLAWKIERSDGGDCIVHTLAVLGTSQDQ